jgi:hypothetical protein
MFSMAGGCFAPAASDLLIQTTRKRGKLIMAPVSIRAM